MRYGRGYTKPPPGRQLLLGRPQARGVALDLLFNEGAGVHANDLSGDRNHGALSGPLWVGGKDGYALFYDGASNYIDAGNKSSLNVTGGSVSLRLNLQVTNAYGYIYDARAGAGTGYMHWTKSDKTLRTSLGTVYIDGKQNAVLSDNEWHNVVVVGVTLAVDTALYIGAHQGLSSSFLKGLLSDFTIYSRILSVQEIKRLNSRERYAGYWRG